MTEHILTEQTYFGARGNTQLIVSSEYIDDGLIEEIWQDLGGRISHEHIRQTVYEVAARYQDAKISTFIPIFIRRVTKERLGLLRNRKSSSAQ